MNWKDGRRNLGYFKHTLFRFKDRFDGYILKFPKGSYLPLHEDEVLGRKHYRLNIVLNNSFKGGKFFMDKAIINTKRIKFFRADWVHQLTYIEEGTRYVFSIGFTTRIK